MKLKFSYSRNPKIWFWEARVQQSLVIYFPNHVPAKHGNKLRKTGMHFLKFIFIHLVDAFNQCYRKQFKRGAINGVDNVLRVLEEGWRR